MDTKNFLMSKTFIGLGVAVGSMVAAKYGITVDSAGLTNDVVSLVGVALAAYGRVKADKALQELMQLQLLVLLLQAEL